MRNFYAAYQGSQKLQPLVAEIGWSHNLTIFEKCKDDLEREFYIRMTKAHGWSKNVLIHQIENQTYRKTFLNQTNFATTLPAPSRAQATIAIKDEYLFDFLELGDEFSERQLESAILARVEPFLQQMGGVFAFVGSQYRLQEQTSKNKRVVENHSLGEVSFGQRTKPTRRLCLSAGRLA